MKKPNIQIGVEKLADGRFKGTYQVTAYGQEFPKRITYGLFVDAASAKIGAEIDAKMAIDQGIFLPSMEDMQRKRFQESALRRKREAQDLKDHIKREVKKKLMRLAHTI